jgi:TRAP-type C4-dicarboxylate transport system permease small subunit
VVAATDGQIVRRLEHALYLVSKVAAWIAGGAVLLMALLGGLDLFTTVALGRPVNATVEATEILMVISSFMCLGLLHKRRAYIAVDLLRASGGLALRLVLDWFALVLMAAYFGLIAWRGWEHAFESFAVREFSSGLVRIPLYPSKFALATGMSIAVLWCVVEMLKGGLFRDPTPTGED